MPTTMTIAAVSTKGFKRAGGSSDPFGADAWLTAFVEQQSICAHAAAGGSPFLVSAKRNQYAHFRPSCGEIEYFDIPAALELSADIAPESPARPRTEVSDAFRDALGTFTFRGVCAAFSGEETRPLLPAWAESSNNFNLRDGFWITQKRKDLTGVDEVATIVSSLRNCRSQPMSRPSVPSLAEAIDSFTDLGERWDSYSAPPPSRQAAENAKALVLAAAAGGFTPARVEPSAMGGIGVTFSHGSREAVVEFYNNGTAHALFVDDATDDMDTRPVTPTAGGYREFLGGVRDYLYGQQTAANARRSDVP